MADVKAVLASVSFSRQGASISHLVGDEERECGELQGAEWILVLSEIGLKSSKYGHSTLLNS